MKKKFWAGLALASVMLVTAACGANGTKNESSNGGEPTNASGGAEKTYTIAVSQIIEHASLDSTYEGFKAALKDAGLEEGKNVKFDYNIAQGDISNIQSISDKIASSKSDLALAIATPSAVSLAETVKDMPVLFAAVTDPVKDGVVSQLEAPGGNVTGASDTNPDSVKQLMEFIAKEFPNVKKLGIVINEGESNAVTMAEIAEEALAAHNIELVRAPIANTTEVQQAAESLATRVDAMYVVLDNMVISGVDSILEIAEKNKIPFFSADRDTVEKGAFATVGFKYYDHGYEVGQMAVEILKNGKKPGEMNVTVPQKLDFILNLKAAENLGITVTDEMKAYVQDQDNNLLQ